MKKSELRQIIREEIIKKILKESRVPFKGRTVSDLYNVVKNMDNFEVFANNNYYTLDVDDLRQNKLSDTVYLLDKDGESKESKVSDIEFITTI